MRLTTPTSLVALKIKDHYYETLCLEGTLINANIFPPSSECFLIPFIFTYLHEVTSLRHKFIDLKLFT
jgi:hypothetical protein